MPTVRLGMLTLPLAGLLAVWATIAGSTIFDLPDTAVDPEEAARAYDSLGYFFSQFAGFVIGLTLLTLGVFALTVYLAEVRRERWVLGATVLSVLGTGLLLSIYGLRTYAVPALGGAYLGGRQNAIDMANIIFGYPTATVFLALLGRLHPLRLRRVGFRDAAQVGGGPPSHPRPAPLRAAAGPVFGVGRAALARWRRVGRLCRPAQAPGPSGVRRNAAAAGRDDGDAIEEDRHRVSWSS